MPGLTALALTAAFLFLPVVGSFMMFVLPAPMGYARARYGFLNFAFISALCVGMVSLTGGFPLVTLAVLGLCITGYMLGGSVTNGEEDGRAVFKAALTPLLVIAPALGFYFLAAGLNPWSLLSHALDQGMKESVELYKQMGMSQGDIDSLMPSIKLFSRVVMEYLPAIVVAMSAAVSFISWFLLKRRAVKAGLVTPDPGSMTRWHAPDHAVWGIIIPGFLMIPPDPLLRQAAGNVLAVFAVVYLFQGLSVVTYLFEKLKLTSALKGLGFLLIALQPFLILAMWAVGFFDTWADFRKLRPKPAAHK